MTPESEAALADAIKSANGPLSVRGGGTRGIGVEGTALSASALSGISLYEPGALTMVAGAGTPVEEIEAALAKEGQRLAFEPMDHRALLGTQGTPTIGAVVSANISGPRRIQGGAARDYALGVRFVDGTGAIVKNGGRVMKNVTGYDLVKLMSGAHGTLGVLTEVALKVLPVPETQATLMLRKLSDDAAVRAMSRAMGSPFEVTGAAHCAKIDKQTPVTVLRIEGFDTSVKYRIGALKDLLADTGAEMEVASSAMSQGLWQSIRDVTEMEALEGDVWRVSCQPSQAAALAASSGAEGCYFDWGGGLIWIRTKPGTDLRAHLGAFEGHATLVRASAETFGRLPKFQPENDSITRISAGLRARFDPRGILNRGLMGPVLTEGV
ncbi:MAG: FAD-binding protein [Roseobacter sp.]|nr:FAD-binding protein [Roseobacter sp.]